MIHELAARHARVALVGRRSKRLGPRAKAAMVRPATSVWISGMSAWELAIKFGAGRVRLGKPPEETISELLESGFTGFRSVCGTRLPFEPCQFNTPIPLTVCSSRRRKCEDLTIVTVDSAIAAYGVPTLDASV